jgi:hypothetical protein
MGRKKISYTWLCAGLGAGLVAGTAHVAVAKLQCPSDTLHGRIHSIAIASSTVDGAPNAVPSPSAAPVLSNLSIKTEFYDHPEVVHLDAFDPGATPPVRKLHFIRSK